eukprot:172394-Lingulodinium_polyedra.AAC.1
MQTIQNRRCDAATARTSHTCALHARTKLRPAHGTRGRVARSLNALRMLPECTLNALRMLVECSLSMLFACCLNAV